MKIALVVHDFINGTGHGRYCIELARRFARDHEVHVLANRFEVNLEFSYRPRFVTAWRSSALASVLTFPAAAQRILDAENFDVVHAQGFSCRRADVITAHVCNAARYKQTPGRGLKRVFPALVIPRERAFFRSAGASEIISVSRVIQRELETEYGLRSHVIYHGIDAQEFTPSQKHPENSWLFVGEAVKGLAPIIDLLPKFPKARLRVVSRSSLAEFQFLAKRQGVESRVDFLGPQEAMAEVYKRADFFLYPSTYDAFGMVVAEAMASGLVVFVGRNIGAAEWIRDGQNGFLCDPSNLGAVILSAQSRPSDELRIIREAARATALEHTWDRCAAPTLETYQRAISSKRVRK